MKTEVKAEAVASENKKPAVLGVFTGKCCDSNILNHNDMHLSRELFEKLMESDEYKRAMANKHYIGYAGHPEDSDCQDFEHACIVMTDMRIADNGDIEGDFDLLDTPVGRVIKSFIDAGVKFGISIRGLGDVDGNGEVDPDAFIFRGFDLVTFPAYDDCIPEFKAIAASTDTKKQAKYKKVCAAINANIKNITSCEALELIKEELPDSSDEFNLVAERINELTAPETVEEAVAEEVVEKAAEVDVTEQKLDAMTDLYLDAQAQVRELEQTVTELETTNQDLTVECKTLKHRQARMKKLVANQLADANASLAALENKYNRSEHRLSRVKASLSAAMSDLKDTQAKYKEQINANTDLQTQVDSLMYKSKVDKNTITASENLNLKYQQKIEANNEAISQKDSEIEELNTKLSETVTAQKEVESRASDLDETNKELLSRVEAAEEMVLSYQQAFADMYANALGVCLTGLPITASTSVDELKQMIKSGTSTAGIPANPSFGAGDAEYIDGDEDEDLFDDVNYGADMVTL